MYCRSNLVSSLVTGTVLALALSGCSSDVSNKNSVTGKTPDKLYKEASSMLKHGSFSDAADTFNQIESLFPYSSKAAQGQIMAAYCHFLGENYTDASRELEIFGRYHSSHKLMPYALYLKAMCVYMRIGSVGRDAKVAQDAREAFMELINRYPDSKYYADSIKKVGIIDGLLAAREMMVGRFYQKRSNFFAAMGRYNFVISNFGHTNQVAEAYYRLIECCLEEGMLQEAEGIYGILQKKYAENKWKKKADVKMHKAKGHTILIKNSTNKKTSSK